MKDTADLARYLHALPRLFQRLANCVPCNCYYISQPPTPTFTTIATIATVGNKKEKLSLSPPPLKYVLQLFYVTKRLFAFPEYQTYRDAWNIFLPLIRHLSWGRGVISRRQL